MTTLNEKCNAPGLSSGAEFMRCALQVNPNHYSGTYRGQDSGKSAEQYVEAVIDKAAEIGVSVLAVTDHNDVSQVSLFREAASGRKITIFPGFEISSSEGIHVLCLYPQDTDEQRLERFLGEFGIRETTPNAGLSTHPFEQILRSVRQQEGITIAAHVTSKNGLFEVLSGRPRIRAWQTEYLLAVQIPGPVSKLPYDVRQILENKNHDYRRVHVAGERQTVAAINAKDIAKPEDLDDHSATCWIKMSDISIEGLRQAFLDPDSRIRLIGDPEPEEHAELLSLAWEGGFLDGAAINFNPNLNVLIGGRGTGKSTVVESLRYVLGVEPIGEEASKAHLGMVRQVLRNGTKISLRVRSHRPTKREYRIERTVPNPPVVRDDSGQTSNLLPADILPNTEVYGQHEISELTRSREKLTHLLDRFVDRDPSLARRKAAALRDLEKTRRSILDTQAELDLIEDHLEALPGLEETLERFREAGLEDRLLERSLLVREKQILVSIPDRLDPLRRQLEAIRQEVPIDRMFVSIKALEELPGKQILAEADGILERLSSDLEEVVRRFHEALARAMEGVNDIGSRWNERERAVQSDYEKILRDLQRSAVDGEEFIRLRNEIESLRPLGERRSFLQRLVSELSAQRRELLNEWEDLKAQEFRLLDRAARKVGVSLGDRVQVDVTAAGNREPLLQLLRDEIGGRLSEAIDAISKYPDLSLPELVENCRRGSDELSRTYAIPPAQSRRLADASIEVLMRIEELELPPTTVIRLNTSPPGEPPGWQTLEDLSTGQKATAVLLLLLLESDSPLIVDQPEDDLDNRFITEGIVPRMREEKRRRQFIFATHNANIPVLGDAELILGLTAKGEASDGKARIAPEHTGSIDAQPVRELVEDLLEGGQNAFETRRLKYGF